VTENPTIARLETLLLRVRARAAEPRARPVVPPPGPAMPFAGVSAAEEEDEQPTLPPPPIVEAPAPLPALDIDVAVEEPAPVAAAAADSQRQSLHSRERLVAAQPLSRATPEIIPEPAPEIEPVHQEEAAPEIEQVPQEEAPISSRRPVMPEPEERLAEMAFGAAEPSPPRHTPPPESGRLPAVPAAQLEGVETAAAVERPTRELSPEIIRAELAASTSVADVVGEAQAFAPSTFAALVDASLQL